MKKYFVIKKNFNSFEYTYSPFFNIKFLIDNEVTIFQLLLTEYKSIFLNNNNEIFYNFELKINFNKMKKFNKEWNNELSKFFKTEYNGLTKEEFNKLDKREKLSISRNKKLNKLFINLMKKYESNEKETLFLKKIFNYNKYLDYHRFFVNNINYYEKLFKKFFKKYTGENIDYFILNDKEINNIDTKYLINNNKIKTGIIIIKITEDFNKSINKLLTKILNNF